MGIVGFSPFPDYKTWPSSRVPITSMTCFLLVYLSRTAEAFIALASLFLFGSSVSALLGTSDLLLRMKTFEDQLANRRKQSAMRALTQTRLHRGFDKTADVTEIRDRELRAVGISNPQRSTVIEPRHDLRAIDMLEVGFENLTDRGPD